MPTRIVEPPRLALVIGPVCSGKTTYRQKNFPSGDWTILDAGEIFLSLNNGSRKNFGKIMAEEMESIGLHTAREALRLRHNLVTELLLDYPDQIQRILAGFQRLGYRTQVYDIDCSEETAQQRNANRGPNDISAYFTESYHINWLLDALEGSPWSEILGKSPSDVEMETISITGEDPFIQRKSLFGTLKDWFSKFRS